MKIVEAHWSTDPNDSHEPDDADCTYTLIDDSGVMIGIFTKMADAENARNSNLKV